MALALITPRFARDTGRVTARTLTPIVFVCALVCSFAPLPANHSSAIAIGKVGVIAGRSAIRAGRDWTGLSHYVNENRRRELCGLASRFPPNRTFLATGALSRAVRIDTAS